MAAILKSKMAADKRKSQPGKLLIMILEIRRKILIPLASFYPKCLAEPLFWISAPWLCCVHLTFWLHGWSLIMAAPCSACGHYHHRLLRQKAEKYIVQYIYTVKHSQMREDRSTQTTTRTHIRGMAYSQAHIHIHAHCGFSSSCYLLSFFLLFSSLNVSRRRLDVYHTSRHGVVLVGI